MPPRHEKPHGRETSCRRIARARSRASGVAAVALAAGLVAACSSLGSGASESPAITPPPGFPVGSWTTSISREDLRAAGLEGELVDENEGDFVLTFKPDGSWESIQTSTIGVTLREPVFRGHYAVTGDEVRLDPEFPAHYAAEGLYDIVRWKLDGDFLRLTLASHGDEIVAVVYGAHPWRRAAESAVVGTWQSTITKDDLRSAGISDPGLLNENAGRFTRSFLADGTWAMAQESLDASPIHNPAGRGTYTVEGNELRLKIEFPTDLQGVIERYRWSLDGKELRLTMLEPDDQLARIGAETHPWTRTGP